MTCVCFTDAVCIRYDSSMRNAGPLLRRGLRRITSRPEGVRLEWAARVGQRTMCEEARA